MSLTISDVEKIAHLARLELTADEVARYREQLSAVLQFAERLNELDLSNVPPTTHAIARQNVMREDVMEPSLPIEEVLLNAPKQEQQQFFIQPVLDE